MSTNDKGEKDKTRSTAPDDASEVYDVGYGKPPKSGQFTKGQSGNPKGRPRGSRNKLYGQGKKLYDLVMETAYATVTVRDGEKTVSMSMIKAGLKTASIKAAKGDRHALKLMTDLLATAESIKKSEWEDTLCVAVKYKNVWQEFIQYHEKRGLDYDMPLPHPDHIVIDWKTGEVSIDGPMDKTQMKVRDLLMVRIAGLEIEIENVEVHTSEEQEINTFTADDRAVTRHILEMMREQIPPDDPLWLKVRDEYRKLWINYWFYYGDDPHDYEAEWRLFKLGERKSEKHRNGKPTMPYPIDRCDRATDNFHVFMREHLKAEMGEDGWASRLEQDEHRRRNIENDYALYYKHCDQNEYGATGHEEGDAR